VNKYLQNGWYAAAHSFEVTTSPLARTLLDEPVVIYRTAAGAATALQDRCPHRFAPLSLGKVQGEELECGYHGLRFNGAGVCSHNPHGPIPGKARVRSYPVTERFGFIWYWPGDPAQANPDLLPDFPFLVDPENFTVIPSYLHVKGNYQLVVDNLLDLSHALFVHPHFAIPGQTVAQQLATATSKVVTGDNAVSVLRQRTAVPAQGPTRAIFGFGPELVDSRSNMHWFAPSVIRFDVGTCLTGTPEKDGLCIPQAHLITPETELTSHYFVAVARNLGRDNPEIGKQLYKNLDMAFREQDEPMIAATQRSMGASAEFDSLNPILLRTDAGPVAARRVLQRLIAKEQAALPFSAAEVL
jgi:phenylpropionate dioxygenase-like ring-hydroxylating dioxygenase large terminal subunit